jgi:hypothetical protein
LKSKGNAESSDVRTPWYGFDSMSAAKVFINLVSLCFVILFQQRNVNQRMISSYRVAVFASFELVVPTWIWK